jgi:dUTP pyrophosphatase
MELEAGSKFCQGIFLMYGITTDDEASGVRNGGFGSTGA